MRFRLALQVAVAGVMAVSLASCSSCSRGGSAAREDLTLLPKESSLLLALNAPRLRDTAMWRKLLDWRDQPNNKKEYDRFVTECGLDPAKQVDSVLVALPSPASGSNEFGAIVRGQFDEAKLVACAKQRVGHDIKVVEHGGKKLYNDEAAGSLFFTFLDGKTLAAGGPEWTRKIVDLAAGKAEAGGSAKENPELMALVKKVKTGDAFWGVGIVPDAIRQKIAENPALQVARSMKDVYGSIDFATGLRLDLIVELGAEAEAKEMAQKLGEQLAESKKNPKVMMLGLATTLDAIKTSSEGAAFRLTANLNQTQLDQTVERVQGLLQAGGLRALGGAGDIAPPVPSPTPSGDDPQAMPPEPTENAAPPMPGGGLKLKMPELPR